jgi:putative FmdB family regulatory protein
VPTYQYACTECGHGFEQFQSFSDDALTECPTCGGRLRKVFNSVGIVFKGSGFYRNDSREAAAKGKADKESKDTKDSKDKESVGSKSDSSSDTKSDKQSEKVGTGSEKKADNTAPSASSGASGKGSGSSSSGGSSSGGSSSTAGSAA